MQPLAIRKYPDKILRKHCLKIDKVSDRERELFESMVFTMKHFCGIGLAAPQIGILQKLIVAEVEGRIIKLANPKIVKARQTDRLTEGCLSVPEFGIEIERPYEVIVKGLDEQGQNVEVRAKGLLARVLQHEIDHLRGRLIVDYMNMLERVKSKFKHKRPQYA